MNFARVLVKEWLTEYKFKDWTVREGSGTPVTSEEREERAAEIADKLCDHRSWLTHGRSIKIDDLEKMKLRINNYEIHPELGKAIQRYYTLLQMTFSSNIYKVFETVEAQVYRFEVPVGSAQSTPVQPAQEAQSAEIKVICPHCSFVSMVQANLSPNVPLKPGHHPFPKDSKYKCPNCGMEINLSDVKRQIEAQAKQTIVT